LVAVAEIAEPPQRIFGVLVVAQGERIEPDFAQVVELVVLNIADGPQFAAIAEVVAQDRATQPRRR
jgi:hypothetical protein